MRHAVLTRWGFDRGSFDWEVLSGYPTKWQCSSTMAQSRDMRCCQNLKPYSTVFYCSLHYSQKWSNFSNTSQNDILGCPLLLYARAKTMLQICQNSVRYRSNRWPNIWLSHRRQQVGFRHTVTSGIWPASNLQLYHYTPNICITWHNICIYV